MAELVNFHVNNTQGLREFTLKKKPSINVGSVPVKGPHSVVLRLERSTRHIQMKTHSDEVVRRRSVHSFFFVRMSRLKSGNFKNNLRLNRRLRF